MNIMLKPSSGRGQTFESLSDSLSAGAIKDVVYNGMEVNIARFFKGVDSALEG